MDQKSNNTADQGQKLFGWKFPEYIKPQRGKTWYFIFFAVVILLLIYSLFTINFLFAVVIIIASIIILMRSAVEPGKVTFGIYEEGVQVDGNFFKFEDIRDFYIIYQPPEVKGLYFDFKSVLKPRLNIPLENQNPIKIRECLLDYLDENLEKEEEPASEAFRKVFKL